MTPPIVNNNTGIIWPGMLNSKEAEPPLSGAQLFAQAQRAESHTDWNGALTIYVRIVEQSSDCESAAQAQFHIADLQYRILGRPTEALDAYLTFITRYINTSFATNDPAIISTIRGRLLSLGYHFFIDQNYAAAAQAFDCPLLDDSVPFISFLREICRAMNQSAASYSIINVALHNRQYIVRSFQAANGGTHSFHVFIQPGRPGAAASILTVIAGEASLFWGEEHFDLGSVPTRRIAGELSRSRSLDLHTVQPGTAEEITFYNIFETLTGYNTLLENLHRSEAVQLPLPPSEPETQQPEIEVPLPRLEVATIPVPSPAVPHAISPSITGYAAARDAAQERNPRLEVGYQLTFANDDWYGQYSRHGFDHRVDLALAPLGGRVMFRLTYSNQAPLTSIGFELDGTHYDRVISHPSHVVDAALSWDRISSHSFFGIGVFIQNHDYPFTLFPYRYSSDSRRAIRQPAMESNLWTFYYGGNIRSGYRWWIRATSLAALLDFGIAGTISIGPNPIAAGEMQSLREEEETSGREVDLEEAWQLENQTMLSWYIHAHGDLNFPPFSRSNYVVLHSRISLGILLYQDPFRMSADGLLPLLFTARGTEPGSFNAAATLALQTTIYFGTNARFSIPMSLTGELGTQFRVQANLALRLHSNFVDSAQSFKCAYFYDPAEHSRGTDCGIGLRFLFHWNPPASHASAP